MIENINRFELGQFLGQFLRVPMAAGEWSSISYGRRGVR